MTSVLVNLWIISFIPEHGPYFNFDFKVDFPLQNIAESPHFPTSKYCFFFVFFCKYFSKLTLTRKILYIGGDDGMKKPEVRNCGSRVSSARVYCTLRLHSPTSVYIIKVQVWKFSLADKDIQQVYHENRSSRLCQNKQIDVARHKIVESVKILTDC